MGAADYSTGWELSFGLFYLIPVSMVAWFQKKHNTFGLLDIEDRINLSDGPMQVESSMDDRIHMKRI